jgi:hypothetical protein
MEIPPLPPPPADPLPDQGPGSTPPSPALLRDNLVEFALAELVRQHRTSFAPLWTVESWAKLLIWLALNAGCPGDTASLEAFAECLGPGCSARLRRLFFSREFETTGLLLVADPAEGNVLVQVASAAAGDASSQDAGLEAVAAALDAVGLTAQVVPDRQRWQGRDRVVVIPLR